MNTRRERAIDMADIEWKRVCCPVDFSQPAHRALDVATDLCGRLGAELVLLHVDGGGRVADELPRIGPVDAHLAAWKEEAGRLGAARVDVARVGGPPEVAIVEYARANAIDLLVLGTHGRVDREHMITGSVAEGVVRNATCPVLTIRVV